ncbi:iron chaperone [Nocardioides jiangxiensis]|uniref:DUF1801 domain-containing protein n=1 Tax=Nocardioides jiangxiensis TaxID=3064524 RepID=A0ABT9AX68_9ACTN|nr:DUF1801 domain-containing protein [Nocardioides sp. WY-20]MDO7866935.1 DUF1801 domain-containing protein [Nocardioides sp. WY-20]
MTEVDSYLAGLAPADAEVIRGYYARALELVPEAAPGRKYAMACLTYRGRGLVSVVRTRKGFSLFPFGSEPVDLVRDRLDGLPSTKGGVQFTATHRVPLAAYDEMVLWSRDRIDRALG